MTAFKWIIGTATAGAVVLAARTASRARSRRRERDRAWARETRIRIAGAEYLSWLERQFAAEEAEEL